MQLINKIRGARHTPYSNANQNNTNDKEDISILCKLQELRDMAWYKAMKYRYDPVLGHTHNEYLQELNKLVERSEK